MIYMYLYDAHIILYKLTSRSKYFFSFSLKKQIKRIKINSIISTCAIHCQVQYNWGQIQFFFNRFAVKQCKQIILHRVT